MRPAPGRQKAESELWTLLKEGKDLYKLELEQGVNFLSPLCRIHTEAHTHTHTHTFTQNPPHTHMHTQTHVCVHTQRDLDTNKPCTHT